MVQAGFLVLEPDSLTDIERALADTFGQANVERAFQGAGRNILASAKRQMPVRRPGGSIPGGTARRSTRMTVRGLEAELNGVFYIENLNEGSSPQAPKGFIDKIVETEVDKFMRQFLR